MFESEFIIKPCEGKFDTHLEDFGVDAGVAFKWDGETVTYFIFSVEDPRGESLWIWQRRIGTDNIKIKAEIWAGLIEGERSSYEDGCHAAQFPC